MDLPAYIRSFAPESVGSAIDLAAKRWGVGPDAVKSWLYRERLPKPANARTIIERERGKISMEQIYGGRP